MHEEDLRRARGWSFEDEVSSAWREEEEVSHEVALEMKLRREDRDLWRIIGSIPNYRGDRSASSEDDVASDLLDEEKK